MKDRKLGRQDQIVWSDSRPTVLARQPMPTRSQNVVSLARLNLTSPTEQSASADDDTVTWRDGTPLGNGSS